MSTGRGRERERAETPTTSARPPAGAKSGRSARNFSSPAPTVPRPATPSRQTLSSPMRASLLRRDSRLAGQDSVRVLQELLHVARGLADAVLVLDQADPHVALAV